MPALNAAHPINVESGSVPSAARLTGPSDFDGNGSVDIIWDNMATGDRGIWLMNGTIYSGWVYLGRVPTEWRIVR